MTTPFAVFSIKQGKGRRYVMRLQRSSTEDRRILRALDSARRWAQRETTYERAGRSIKRSLDSDTPSLNGKFLVDWAKDPSHLQSLDLEFIEALIEACSKVGDRYDSRPRLRRKTSGAFYLEIKACYRTLLLQVTRERRLTIVSYVSSSFSWTDERDWHVGHNWQPSQGGSHFEWQGEAPGYLFDILDEFGQKKDQEILEKFTAAFWELFAPSLEDPFIDHEQHPHRILVGADDVTIQDPDGTFASNERLGRFTDIMTELLRAFGPEWDSAETMRGPELVIEAAWDQWRNNTLVQRHRARLKAPHFELSPELLGLMRKLVKWADLKGSRYMDLNGVTASTGKLGPALCIFEIQVSGNNGHARLEAAQRAADGLRAIGFKPEQFGL